METFLMAHYKTAQLTVGRGHRSKLGYRQALWAKRASSRDRALETKMDSSTTRGESPTTPGDGPVKIRAYGLFPITRRGYVIVQTCCVTAILLAMAWLAIAPPDTDAYRKLAEKAPVTDRPPIEAFAKVLDHAHQILLAILALGAVETVWMLRKFRAAEARGGRTTTDSAANA